MNPIKTFSLPMYVGALLWIILQASITFSEAAQAESFAKAVGVSFGEQRPPGPIPMPLPYPIPSPTCYPNHRYVVVPQYVPVSGSFLAKAPEMTLFNNAYLDAVYKSDILKYAFDLSKTSGKQYASFLREYSKQNLIALKIPNAEFLADLLYKAVMTNFGCPGCPRLILAIVTRIYGNIIGHSLYIDDILTIDNAADLGRRLAQSIAETANVRLNSDPTSKFLVISEGSANFMYSEVSNIQQMATTFAAICNLEFYSAKTNYKYW